MDWGWTLIAVIVGLVVLGELAFQLWLARFFLPLFEQHPPFNVEVGSPDADAEQISFPTTHGLTLRGSLYRHDDHPSLGLIIFCHEFGGDHCSAISYCDGLWRAGFNILAFDFRNQGESDRIPNYQPRHWLSEYEIVDVLAALEFVRQREDLRWLPVGLFGISRGGGAALAAGARRNDVQCVACEGAYSTYSVIEAHYSTRRWATLLFSARMAKWIPKWHNRMTLSLVRWVSQFRNGCRYVKLERWLSWLRNKPVLLISGKRDTYVLPQITEDLRRRIGGEAVEEWIVPGAKHNKARQVDLDEYDNRLIEFFGNMKVESAQTETALTEPVRKSTL